MTQLIAVLALMACSFAAGIWILMAGWGMQPQSWGVILGGFSIQMGIMILIQGIRAENT